MFNSPNPSLFSSEGRWLQNDMDTPLDSWKYVYAYLDTSDGLIVSICRIEDVVAAGKVHGAQREDLYGCLYFYLSKELRSFSDRLKTFQVSIRIFDRDASQLVEDVRSGTLEQYGLPNTTQFDRIEVSNILDTEYVGIPDVLADWAPFLSRTNRHATLLGYSMNWVPKQPDAQPGPTDFEILTQKLVSMGKVSDYLRPSHFY